MGTAKQNTISHMPRAKKKTLPLPEPIALVAINLAPTLDQFQHMRASVNLSTLRTNAEGEQRFFYVTRENQVGWIAADGERQECGFEHGLEANQEFHDVVKNWESGV